MKTGIHPVYKKSHVVCACGNIIDSRSTKGDFHIDICSNCHPFYTGKQKLMDTEGRVDAFRRKYAKTDAMKAEAAARKPAAPAMPPPAPAKKAAKPAKPVETPKA